MHDFTELDRNINLNKPENYHISIQVSPDGFSFCLLETYIGRYVGVKHYHFKKNLHFDVYLEKINQVIASDPLLKVNYGSSSVMFVNEKSLLIPGEIFKPEQVKSFFNLHQQLGEFDEIHYNHIPFFDAYNVFSQHHELLNVFREKYRDIGIYHQWTPLLMKPEIEDAITGMKAIVNFNEGFFDLLVVRERKLLLCNSFTFKNENDFVFYLLNVFKQLKIENDNCGIVVIGDTGEKGRYFELLGKFVKNFEIGDAGDGFSFSPTMKNISRPNFYNLYNLYRCVSLEESTEG